MQTLGNIVIGAMLATASLGPAPWFAAGFSSVRPGAAAEAVTHALEASVQSHAQALLHSPVFRGMRNGS